MKKNLIEESKRWFKQSEADLDDAKYNLIGRRYNVACFLAQQAIEKTLKAYLFFYGIEEVWGHSVTELCDDIISLDKSFVNWKEKLAPMDKYYIPTRYPNALPGGIPKEVFDEEDAKKAVSLAEEIIKFIGEKTGFLK